MTKKRIINGMLDINPATHKFYLLIMSLLPGLASAHVSGSDLFTAFLTIYAPFVIAALLFLVSIYRFINKKTITTTIVIACISMSVGGLIIYSETHPDIWGERLSNNPEHISPMRPGLVTDELMVELNGQTRLQNLFLMESYIKGPGLVHLKTVTTLRILNLSFSDITDEGTRYLVDLTQIKELDLAHTKITNNSVVHLSKLQHLERLDISGTEIDDEGLNTLKKSLTKTEVRF